LENSHSIMVRKTSKIPSRLLLLRLRCAGKSFRALFASFETRERVENRFGIQCFNHLSQASLLQRPVAVLIDAGVCLLPMRSFEYGVRMIGGACHRLTQPAEDLKKEITL